MADRSCSFFPSGNSEQPFPPGWLFGIPVGFAHPAAPPSHTHRVPFPPPVPMETSPGLLNSSENHFNLKSGLGGILIVNRNEKQFWDIITFVSHLQQN